MSELAEALESLIGQSFLITTSPEVLDFTNPKAPANLIIIAKGQKLTIPLPRKCSELNKTIGQVRFYLSQANLLLAWNIKNLFSYVRAVTGKELRLSVRIVDLKLLEAFLGMFEPCPATFKQAKARLEVVTANSYWPQLKNIYKTIHMPLALEVIPQIETLGLADTNRKTILHPYYEIEGTNTGRMKGFSTYLRSFNPHSLSETEKEILTTPDFDDKEFLCFDFKNMEVSVLQWLSQDKVLGSILSRGRDVYESIWETITGLDCSPSRRKVCKSFFLPVVFGMGSAALSERTKVTEEVSKKIVSQIYKIFPTALGWVSGKDVINNVGIDYFGRHRYFTEDYYKNQLRNFHIQAPASIVCLHKLVNLYKNISGMGRISFHVHDGYVIIPKKGEENRVLKICKDTLEAEDPLYPGLKLRVKSLRGINLNQLKEV